MYPPTTSESSAGNSSSESSAGPSRKRYRSPAATVTSSIHATRALVPSHADLLPPRKRFRDSISPEDSVEEDIDTDVLADIEANAMVDEVTVDRDVEAGVDAGVARLISVMRIEDIEIGQRELEARSLIYGGERASLLEQVASLERSTVRPLHEHHEDERARADRFRRRMSFMESELWQIRRLRYYNRMRFRRLETFTVRHLDDSESDTEILERHVSPTTSTLEIPTASILPAPSAVVAPSSEALTVRNLVRPLPSHCLALRYASHHLDHFTSRSSAGHSSLDHSSSGNSILGYSLAGHSLPDTTIADSSTP
ncbi:hypothetical protein Tco_1379099 [Tanacetum coccineum]